jgi:hypothetical protein
LKLTKPILFIVCVFVILLSAEPALGWSNGGYSADPSKPDYGTHDWIAQHALFYLPAEEKQYLIDNLAAYLYGTELPDLPASQGGIGDTTKHHVYYSASGALVDDASAQRAADQYSQALNFLKTKDYLNASKAAGAMAHYISDLAVFGHVMGASTPWGTEIHHSDYEDHVNRETKDYASSFNSYLSYDGGLSSLSAYNATVNLAYNTVFGGTNNLTCVWMDTNYNWSSTEFSGRCGESLNLAVNAVADVLHTLYTEANSSPLTASSPSPTPTVPEFPAAQALAAVMLTVIATVVVYKKHAPKPKQS